MAKNKKAKGTYGAFLKGWGIFLVLSIVLGACAGAWLGNRGGTSVVDLDNSTGGVVNILLLGSDGGGMRSDTIMLVNINGETGKVNILSLPRDTAIFKQDANGRVITTSAPDKLNSYLGKGQIQYNNGEIKVPELAMMKKVKEITGLPINYYATIDFDGFKHIIDILGGVDYEVPENMDYDDPAQDLHIHLKAGMQHLDGQAAHDFVRYRNYKNGRADLARIEAQQAFIKALVKQKLTPSNINKIDELYDAISKYVNTNYKFKNLMSSLGTIKNITEDDVTMYVLPNTPRMIMGGSYVVYNDTEEHRQELKEILENFKSEAQKKAEADAAVSSEQQ